MSECISREKVEYSTHPSRTSTHRGARTRRGAMHSAPRARARGIERGKSRLRRRRRRRLHCARALQPRGLIRTISGRRGGDSACMFPSPGRSRVFFSRSHDLRARRAIIRASARARARLNHTGARLRERKRFREDSILKSATEGAWD